MVAGDGLSVAVTGPTGTFGSALMPLLEEDDRVGRVVGIARRPFDPGARGWSKMEYRQGDVRDPDALRAAFEGADVVVHLAFLIVGGNKQTTGAINVEGTLNAFRAAAEAGARRFVYASSIAAYGFHRDNPIGIPEDWATRPAEKLFYAQEKAELEHLLGEAAADHPDVELYLLRPPIVLGPDAVGAKVQLPQALAWIAGGLQKGVRRLPALPALVPDLPVQLIHQDDVASALLRCTVGAGPAGAYNIAADDVLSLVDLAREAGLRPVPIPGGPVAAAARAAAKLPLPPTAQWVEALSHPAIMDTTKAKTELGWTPQHSALDALRATLD
ncbi:epimerase [Nocardioides silvaticus]|uniref:Epimerase n=1 Tax=Nocardioides silvaticus TaxID=2201891 RepID=A0A316TSY4_9ACTN|nr:NAD-dependent epimerase/dehydratase family protein [Nocardioides silvaticus]PWN02656.1 epimerase [Nocardioides silvaticus]